MTYIDPRSKLLFHTDHLADLRRTGKTHAPVNVEIDLSNRCSHGCSWCHFAHTHTRGPLAGSPKPEGMLDCGDLMDTKLARDIVMQLRRAGVKSVTWTGGGEPTLHPEFDRIIEYAHVTGMEQGLYTHGGHINRERAELLKRSMTFVYVSLDESNAESFYQSKGVRRFHDVVENVRYLVSAPGKATIGLGFLLHRGNIDDVDTMVALGRSLKVDYVQFRPVIQYEQATPDQLIDDAQWVNGAINNLRTFAGDSFVQADAWRFEMYRDWRRHGYATCNWAALQTVITPNGQMWRCVNRRGHRAAWMGDLTTDTFVDIWRQAGGACTVESDCRLMCRGHISNLTLDAMLTEPVHANFI